jgi:hypothetical protein
MRADLPLFLTLAKDSLRCPEAINSHQPTLGPSDLKVPVAGPVRCPGTGAPWSGLGRTPKSSYDGPGHGKWTVDSQHEPRELSGLLLGAHDGGMSTPSQVAIVQ